jgi:transcriptional regulator
MLAQHDYAWPGTTADLNRLIAAHPWATMISATSAGLVVSHLPIVPDTGTTVLGHLPVADARQHELGTAETVLVVHGPHGYVSASWYATGPYVSTWNYVVVHLHGRAEPLDEDDTFGVLDRTQDHLEAPRQVPYRLDRVPDYARRAARHVTGFRLTPARVRAKAKLSQDKPAADRAGVLRGLEDPGDVHANPDLAAAMRNGGITR